MKKPNRKNASWTPEEVQLLKDSYLNESVADIAETLGRTKDSVYFKAATLNLYRRKDTKLKKKRVTLRKNAQLPRWSDEEINFLLINKEKMSTTEIAKKLGRSYNAVIIKRASLNSKGVKAPDSIITPVTPEVVKPVTTPIKPKENSKTSWTIQEEDTLRNLYSKVSLTEIAKKLGRSESAVKSRAYALDLIPRKLSSKFKWSPAEIDYVRKNIDKKSNIEIARYLGRSVGAVANMANRYKIYRSFPKKSISKSWVKPVIISAFSLSAAMITVACIILL